MLVVLQRPVSLFSILTSTSGDLMASFEIVELDKDGKPRPFPAGVFPDGKSAASILAELKLKYPTKKFQPRPIKDETENWRAREERRFTEGVYEPLGLSLKPISDHFAHKAIKIPANVAYTPEPQQGVIDKQVSVHIRTYLQRFYPKLSIAERRQIVWDYCGEKFGDEMQIARTREEIAQIYINGPSSCMSYDADNWGLGPHPTEAYASPDLGIAYLKNNDGHIIARSLVAVDKKIHSTIYGDREKLLLALKDNGYTQPASEDWQGLRLLKIDTEDGYLCPYLDSFVYVRVLDDDYLVICGYKDKGAMNGQDTDGEIYPNGRYRDEDYDY